MVISRLVVVAVLLAGSSWAAPWEVAAPPSGQWVVDTTGTLTPEVIAQLNALSTAINDTRRAQLSIAMISTTSGVAPREFATKLFNHWGVGRRTTNDGVLIFAAIADRKAEIILGRGSTLTPSQTDVVMKNDVIAHFKRGDPSGAMVSAAEAVAALLNVSPQANASVPMQATEAPIDPAYARLARGEQAFADYSPRHWLIDLSNSIPARDAASIELASNDVYAEGKGRVFILVTNNPGAWPTLGDLVARLKRQVNAASSGQLGVVAIDQRSGDAVIDVPFDASSAWERGRHAESVSRLQAGARSQKVTALRDAAAFASSVLVRGMPPRPMRDVLDAGFERFGPLILLLGIALAIGFIIFAVRYFRNRPRTCASCHQPRQLLGDFAEKKFLTPAQTLEEGVGSVQYNVWWCPRCRDTEIRDHAALFSRYKSCEGCGHRTSLRSDGQTLRWATTYQGGLIEVTETCASCGHTKRYTRSTPRLRDTSWSSNSYDSSSSGSSSFSDSFSSSSSSSDSGGGSSSGSGSSGSW